MSSNKGWQEVLKPFLEAKAHNTWIDPREFDNKDELAYAYLVAWGFAEASKGLIEWVDAHKEQLVALTAKERGEVKDKFKGIFSKGVKK